MTTKSSTESPVADFNAILALLQDVKTGQDKLGSRLDDLEGRVEAQASSLPKITPTEAYAPWESDSPLEVMARLGPNGEIVGEMRSAAKGEDGRTLSEHAVTMHPPTYHAGQDVRINPESVHIGWPKGMDWANRLAFSRSSGRAKIIKVLHLARNGEWFYRIKIDRCGGLNGLLMVADHELLPA